MVLERQPRERAALCWCRRTTWNLSGLCDPHDPDLVGAVAMPAPGTPRRHTTGASLRTRVPVSERPPAEPLLPPAAGGCST